jgi:aspartyl-tRNA(Asn)/glutamyl-tRNA(Gln) amidotransferase subunit C
MIIPKKDFRMKIDEKLLSKLEKLSMIEIEKREQMVDELNKIVEFVEILNEIDTDGVEATFNTLNRATPLREDIAVEKDVVEVILTNAPKVDGNYFIVPKIIE